MELQPLESGRVAAVIIVCLATVAWYMVRGWKKNVETRMLAHDRRLDIHTIKHSEQDVFNATVAERMDHIVKTGDQTALDVKELLKPNGKRNTG